MHVGCSLGGIRINNISYADDMVLLGPSVSAVRKMLSVCEAYAERHGLRYNAKKSEFMIFKSGKREPTHVPPILLNGKELNRVRFFKYLGHVVSEDLKDDQDIERERRALAVRGNMLARRFAKCSRDVKLTLFKSFCQTFYTCGLWVSFTLKAYNALRVQYNNLFRMLLRLPRYCSASAMFASAHTDDFYAIMRNRAASLAGRTRDSGNSILRVIADRLDGPIVKHWVQLQVCGNRQR